MDCPQTARTAHRQLVSSPRTTRGQLADSPWTARRQPTDGPRTAHGQPKNSPWTAREQPIDGARTVHGQPADNLRVSHGRPTVRPRTAHRQPMDSSWEARGWFPPRSASLDGFTKNKISVLPGNSPAFKSLSADDAMSPWCHERQDMYSSQLDGLVLTACDEIHHGCSPQLGDRSSNTTDSKTAV